MDKFACGCSLDNGPCSSHGSIVVVREGLLTAVERDLQLLADIQDLGIRLAPWTGPVIADVRAAIAHGAMDDSLEADFDLVVDGAEWLAGEAGYAILYTATGFVIFGAVSIDCPLLWWLSPAVRTRS